MISKLEAAAVQLCKLLQLLLNCCLAKLNSQLINVLYPAVHPHFVLTLTVSLFVACIVCHSRQIIVAACTVSMAYTHVGLKQALPLVAAKQAD